MKAWFCPIYITLAGIFFICGCIQHTAPRVTVMPAHFNIQIPFQTDSRGILINTYWGKAKIQHSLYLDNHSPTWASNTVINGNGSISKSKDFLYSTTTADGKKIEGEVFECDSIGIGNISFKKVSFYNISNVTNRGKSDGVIGEDIMMEAIWKIDFENQQIQLASSIDSIAGLQDCELMPAQFTSDAIEIETVFSHAINKKMELDLGYNGWIILPAAACKSIIANSKKVYKDSVRFSTPAGEGNISNTVAMDSVQIGKHIYPMLITTNEMVKEKLIGWRFFSGFDCIIIDYINKKLYVSKKAMNE